MDSNERTPQVVERRHGQILYTGVLSVVAGLLISGYVAVEWFLNDTSHEVLAVVAAAGILLGTQLLVLSMLSGMMLILHREQQAFIDGLKIYD